MTLLLTRLLVLNVYLVNSSGVRYRVGVLDDRDRLSSQDGLVNSQSGGVDLDQSDVSWDLVTNCIQNKLCD